MTNSEDAKRLEMLALVGECLTYWQHTEGKLVGILAECIDITYPIRVAGDVIPMGRSQMAGHILYAVDAFRPRLNIVDAGLKALVSIARDQGNILEEWELLKKRLRRLNDTRNKIAHGQVLLFLEQDRIRGTVIPPLMSPRAGKVFLGEQSRIEANDIRQFIRHAGQLAGQLEAFGRALNGNAELRRAKAHGVRATVENVRRHQPDEVDELVWSLTKLID